MLFTSYEFWGFIACLFLLYYLIPRKYQWVMLLAASYIFYFLAHPTYLIYISVTTMTTFYAAMRIGQLLNVQKAHLELNKETFSKEEKQGYKSSVRKKQRKWFIACLLINFGILAFLKYTNFTIANINSMLSVLGTGERLTFMNVILPMGISFYTFQAMGYLIDVYQGKIKPEKSIFRFALFVSFFPQLVQGPISRFNDLSATLYEEHRFDFKEVSYGFQRILWGLFKKLVIADRILVAVNTIIKEPDEYNGVFVFVGMMFYAIQLYADFTGGIDITIGIAEVLGIRIKENFNAPFLAKNITDYWRRWHITMGTWFRDYLFYPLSVSGPILNLSRWSRRRLGDGLGRKIPVYLTTLIVWFATGLWHGSSWNFIAWGLTNGIVIIISQAFEPLYARFHNKFPVKGKPLYSAFEVIRTVLLMSAIRMFDCYRDVPLTFRMFGSMFTTGNFSALFDREVMKLGLSGADYIVLAATTVILIASGIRRKEGSMRDRLEKIPARRRYLMIYLLGVIILLFGAYGVGYDATQFIYNQF